MSTPLKIIIGMALLSSLLLLVLSGFISSSVSNDSAIIGTQIFVFVHLYPTNLIASYLAGRSLQKHSPGATYKSVLILWLVQGGIILVLVGLFPFLLLLSFGMLFLGKKHQQRHEVV